MTPEVYGEKLAAPTYACLPPGVHHGPFKPEQAACCSKCATTTRAKITVLKAERAHVLPTVDAGTAPRARLCPLSYRMLELQKKRLKGE
jgi:hypothetical protein